jgi:hypothetical protein
MKKLFGLVAVVGSLVVVPAAQAGSQTVVCSNTSCLTLPFDHQLVSTVINAGMSPCVLLNNPQNIGGLVICRLMFPSNAPSRVDIVAVDSADTRASIYEYPGPGPACGNGWSYVDVRISGQLLRAGRRTDSCTP